MKPDRSNYEIWLIDWLDGKLNDQQIILLRSFLDDNPDIREEAESFCHTNITPGKDIFPARELLWKTSSEMPESQIEYLSVAYFENDLSPDQVSDLFDAINSKTENQKIFDSVQKTKLVPADIQYRNKKLLLKTTTNVKVIRIGAAVLSAAAVISLFLILKPFAPESASTNQNSLAVNYISATEIDRPSPLQETGTPHFEGFIAEVQKKIIPRHADIYERAREIKTIDSVSEKTNNEMSVPEMPSSERPGSGTDIFIIPASSLSEPAFLPVTPDNTLSPSGLTAQIYDYDDESSRVGRFLAKTYRSIMLKEKSQDESPLKGYELAEGSINGLNKLLGWEMELQKIKDKNGELKSLYFRSKILKFNTPVKESLALK